ncbi:MAG TPA: ATP-binding protein [Coleofasciculaceae cyanobacterium]|jgi:signal transduction histidine kinase
MSQNGTILIVEDNEMSLKMAQSLLQLAGYATLEASNAEVGIHLAKEHLPNLILMDMHLPVKSGYEASQELKSLPETESIPIVAFTALAMEGEQKRAISHGCTGVISKPIDIKSFAQTVESFITPGSCPDAPIQSSCLHPRMPVLLPEAPACIRPTEKPDKARQDLARQDLEGFLLGASHDLQGPLRKIQQFASLLEQTLSDKVQPGDEIQEALKGISRNAKEMETLLRALLTLARIDYEVQPFKEISLAEVVQGALNRYQTQLRLLNAQVAVGELTHLPADFQQMQLVFEELIGNALKFHREGERPFIQIQGSFSTAGTYEITVRDQGTGFEKLYSERIFKPFQRLHSSGKYSGNGLGLAIVAKIIERHSGTITATGSPGDGAVFTIRLPLQSVPQADT